MNQGYPGKRWSIYRGGITQTNGKIGQLAELQIIALLFFCRMIPTQAALPGPFTGFIPLVRPAWSVMVLHFLWGEKNT